MAEILDLSESTVSRALNNSPLIAEKTRHKVQVLARQLNYEFNSQARSLRTSNTNTIGVIYNQIMDSSEFQPYGHQIYHSLRVNMEKLGYYIIAQEVKHQLSGGSSVQSLLRQKKVDGLIFADADVSVDDFAMAQDRNIPAVQLHFQPKYIPREEIDSFLTDNVAGGEMAVSYLAEKGCQRLFNLSIKALNTEIFDRRKGFLQGIEKHGLNFSTQDYYEIEVTFRNGYLFALNNFERLKNYDAIVCHADIVALGLIQALKEKGMKIPNDLKVIGYDNILLSEEFHPALTTVRQPDEEKAAMACKRLQFLLKNKGETTREENFVTPNIICREST